MKIIILIFFLNFSYASKSLFDTKYYNVQFESLDIENKKFRNKIKLLTFEKIINDILVQRILLR